MIVFAGGYVDCQWFEVTPIRAVSELEKGTGTLRFANISIFSTFFGTRSPFPVTQMLLWNGPAIGKSK